MFIMVHEFHEKAILMVDNLLQKLENKEHQNLRNKEHQKVENTEHQKLGNTKHQEEKNASTSMSTSQLKDITSSLTKHMETKGATGLDNLDIVYMFEGPERALVATQNIKKGDIISIIPAECCLSAHLFDSLPQPPPPYQTFQERLELRDPETSAVRKRILLLLHACSTSANSFLQIYIKSLPAAFPTMPIYWTKRQREQCGPGSMVASLQERMTVEIQTTYEQLLPIVNESKHLFDSERWTSDFCAWAFCCLNSRTFSLSVGSSEIKEDMLIPFYDMMNHSMDYNVQVCAEQLKPEEKKKITLVATSDIKAGGELRNCYRHGDNSQMLVYYGFAIANNPYDVIFVRVKYKGEISMILGMAMGSLGLPPSPDLAIPLSVADPLPQSWIWALRLREMDEEQLQAFIGGQVKITGKQELQVWRLINKEIQRQIKWYSDAQEKLKKWQMTQRRQLLDVMYTGAVSILMRTLEYYEKNAPGERKEEKHDKEKNTQKKQEKQMQTQ